MTPARRAHSLGPTEVISSGSDATIRDVVSRSRKENP